MAEAKLNVIVSDHKKWKDILNIIKHVIGSKHFFAEISVSEDDQILILHVFSRESEYEMVATIEALVMEEGEPVFVVASHLIVSEFDDEFEIISIGNELLVKLAGKGAVKVPTVNGMLSSEFDLPEMTPVSLTHYMSAINCIAYVTRRTGRPIDMSYQLLTRNNGSDLMVAATDGSRIAAYTFHQVNAVTEPLFLPQSSIRPLAAICKDSEEGHVGWTASAFFVRSESITVRIPLLAEKTQVESVYQFLETKDSFPNSLKLNTKELTTSVSKAVKAFGGKSFTVPKILISLGASRVVIESVGANVSVMEAVGCETLKSEGRVCFQVNANYFVAALKKVTSEDVWIYFYDIQKANHIEAPMAVLILGDEESCPVKQFIMQMN